MKSYRKMLLILSRSALVTSKIRIKFLKISGLKIEDCTIRSNVYFDSSNISIGQNCSINHGCNFNVGNSDSSIILEENVFIGMNVNLCCVSHKIGNQDKRAGENTYNSISIGKGSWVGANSVILTGVIIGSGCIIGAGSVVTKNIPENSLWAGNPAVHIRDLA